MNTLDELVYYCNEECVTGAVLLSGEWGCGKTYLVDKKLSDELKDSHIIIRVSLFGMDSIEKVNLSIRQKWFFSSSSILQKMEKKHKCWYHVPLRKDYKYYKNITAVCHFPPEFRLKLKMKLGSGENIE